MLLKLNDNCVVETSCIKAIEYIPYRGHYGLEERSKITLDIAHEVIHVDCDLSPKEIYQLIEDAKKENL